MEYAVHSYTTKSNLHSNNEDNHFICEDYIVIADGMGGECDGDIASRIAVESIVSILSQELSDKLSDSEIKEVSCRAINTSDTKILKYIDEHPDSFGMGTTVLLAIRKLDKLYISWCGDSRCYLYKDGKVSSLTKDHSYVQELIDSGHISVEESFTHPNNNLITRYVGGGHETCMPDFCSHRISDNEIIVLCSDGLSGYCRQNDIAEEISRITAVDKLPKFLSDMAIRHGSEDDITIVTLVPRSYIPHRTFGLKFDWLRRILHPYR